MCYYPDLTVISGRNRIIESTPKNELGRLQEKVDRLSSLIEVGAIISSSLDLDEVLRLVMALARKVMAAEACSILLLNEETNQLEFELTLGAETEVRRTLKEKIRLDLGQGVAGWSALHRESVLVEDARTDDRVYTGADEATGFRTRSLIAVPLINKDELIGVAEVINPISKDGFNQADLELFETFCRQVAIAVDNARFHQAYLAQQRLSEQLGAAASIQRSFLPSPLNGEEEDSFHLEAVSLPAMEVGGDLYDYFMLPGRRLAVLIGDVAGKGVGAALYMARVVSEFRYLARLLTDPGAVINQLNDSLAEGTEFGMFITGVYWLLDLDRGVVSYCNAGHIPSLLKRAEDGRVELIETLAGPPLGIFPEMDYKTSRLQIGPGDSILMLTDGVIEAWDAERAHYGYDRLIELVRSVSGDQSTVARIIEEVQGYVGGAEQTDDLTLLEMTWLGDGNGRQEVDPDRAEDPEGDSVELDISLGPRMMGVVRRVSERMSGLAGLSTEETNGFRLAVDEACTNVLRHAYGGDESRRLRISFDLNDDRLQVKLHDFGVGFDPDRIVPHDPSALVPGGLGFHLIRTVMDEIDYSHSATEGNTLTLTKLLAERGAD